MDDLNSYEQSIIAAYRSLNAEGREKVIDYIDVLVASGKYKKGVTRFEWLIKVSHLQVERRIRFALYRNRMA